MEALLGKVAQNQLKPDPEQDSDKPDSEQLRLELSHRKFLYEIDFQWNSISYREFPREMQIGNHPLANVAETSDLCMIFLQIFNILNIFENSEYFEEIFKISTKPPERVKL